ncbi:hypothetical protein N0V93_008240 [Gnomoniopsis smithogilvyi]|uniref:Uncharacterized protein n=1 Tax=Gnomoniopsis smithogilvyi TaxID=1191159 RepID=A0A9W8YMK0_9PEZI|nr:hypothetical protein N0V93_008240 [Gnomoniopsis smithogilvyi]
MVDKNVRQCGHLIVFDSEEKMETHIRTTTNILELLFAARQTRMTCLHKFVCGDKPETKWLKLYSMVQYLYNDLGHDYWLAKQLHEKIDSRWGLFDPELRKLISDRCLHRRNLWISDRKALTAWLEAFARVTSITAPLAFMAQLDDEPPQFRNRSEGVRDLDPSRMGANHLKNSAIQSPWLQVVEQSYNRDEAMRAQVGDQQVDNGNLKSSVEAVSDGSPSKTKGDAPEL